jgi:hypothetical protein
VHAMKWRPEPPSVGAVSSASGRMGLVVGASLPLQVSGLISLKTDLATRRGRGRIYVPFPSASQSGTAGGASQAYVDNLVILKEMMIGDRGMIGGGADITWRPVIFGRRRDATIDQPALPEIFVEVKSGTALGKWATQRRRGAYGRANVPPT